MNSDRLNDVLADLFAACDRHGPLPALSTEASGTLTYGELAAQVRSVAAGLRARGLQDGDRVLYSVRPEPLGVVLALGIVAAGGTVVFADPGVTPSLFAARLELAAPRWAASESLLYCASGFRLTRALARRRGLLLPRLSSLTLQHLYVGRWLPGVPRGAVNARDLLTAAPALEVSAAPEQEAVIVFTSGTTAAPRAIVHSRGSLGAAAASIRRRSPAGPGDVVHTDQLMVGLPTLTTGAHWTMPPFGLAARADVVRYAAGLARATATFTVPADFAVLLDAVEAGVVPAPTALRRVQLGGAPVLAPLLERAAKLLPGVEFEAVYGMTEIVPVTVVSGAEKVAFDGPGDLLGEPLPGIGARIADHGELLLSGPPLAPAILGEGPLREHPTGDLARWDGDRLVLVGRKKDMIIRRWTNVYPGLYEPALSRLPGVAAALLVGLPDEVGDERVVLAVVPEGLAGESDSDVRVLPDDGLAARVRAAAADVLDVDAMPDDVVLISAVPVTGRARKPDRPALRELLSRPSR
ncbi:class I adenylate-forming enzyme family protein [Spongisporangium articulatum]|uniref:Class I adenylate-forming enzyme family protein n=1 Tax=Spongisporangium articulatum TaxID=3362603 RepID=A0ABW8AMA7_9ACTN